VSGVAGNHDTLGEEIVHSVVADRVSYSIGQFHFETDGFRPNNALDQDIYDLFVQGNISHKTSVQAEFRAADVEKGDLTLNFDPDSFFTDLRQVDTVRTVRIGVHHAVSPGSDIIGSVAYQKWETTVRNSTIFPGPPPLGLSFEDNIEDHSGSGELQHLFRSDRIQVVSGAGHFRVDRETGNETVTQLPPPAPPSLGSSTMQTGIRHSIVYMYSQIHHPKNVTFTVGASGDFYRNDSLGGRNQLNPKLGVTWIPVPSTTVRAAAFRTLKRSLVNDQTLEPTQVTGFNQFFDDPEGTRSWRYGAAVDHAFSGNLYGGAEYSQRELDLPIETTSIPVSPGPASVVIDRVDWRERLGRGYLFWTPHPRLAVSAEYQYERFDRDPKYSAGIEHVATHKVPLGLGFFHPCGIFFRMKETYIDQAGRFQSQVSPAIAPGSDRFWLTDALVGYRLPKRFGIVAVEAKNFFDRSFRFQDTDPVSPVLQPERSIVFKFTVSL